MKDDEVAKNRKRLMAVIPAPIFIGINSSWNPMISDDYENTAALWQVPEREPGAPLLTHYHLPPGSSSVPERMNAKDLFPWITQKVWSGEILGISRIGDLPTDAARDRESYGSYGPRATLMVPLSTGGGPVFGR
jgi:hypothetical protein